MASVLFGNKSYAINDDESVLDCLLRHQVTYPHSCKAGTCQSCLCHTDTANINPDWQKGLKPTLAAKGYFLPCIAYTEDALVISLPNDNDVTTAASIIDISNLNYNIVCLRLSVENLKQWIPGQYVNLINSNGDIRSYSIANLPKVDGYIELHIKIMPSGLMGTWATTQASKGMAVNIRGPIGDCYYYNPEHEAFPMVLVGTGTGLAPLIGIARDALLQDHKGTIHIIHGGINANDLYFDQQLLELSAQHSNVFYERCTLKNSKICEQAAIDVLMTRSLKELSSPKVYICGPSETTEKLRTKAFLSGVASANIYSDAFTIAS